MRKLLARLEALFAAVAFAEAGDADTARQLAPPERRRASRLRAIAGRAADDGRARARSSRRRARTG
jgi:hypothetical protein